MKTLLSASVIVIVTKGIKKRKTKCHILLNFSFFILTENIVVQAKIKGQIRANANKIHFEENSIEVNWSTDNITAKRVIPPTIAAVILDHFEVLTSKFSFKNKGNISLKNLTNLFLDLETVISKHPFRENDKFEHSNTFLLYHIFLSIAIKYLLIFQKNYKKRQR